MCLHFAKYLLLNREARARGRQEEDDLKARRDLYRGSPVSFIQSTKKQLVNVHSFVLTSFYNSWSCALDLLKQCRLFYVSVRQGKERWCSLLALTSNYSIFFVELLIF